MIRARSLVALALASAVLVPVGVGSSVLSWAPDASASVLDNGRTPAAEAAFRDVTRCLNSGTDPSLSVLYLVDQSGSIERDGLKETVIDVLVTSVSQLQRFEDRGIAVEYSVIGFSTGDQEIAPWTNVPSSETDSDSTQPGAVSEDSLRERVRASWPTGGSTDYLSGLQQAQASFEGRGDSCRMLIWMTDGAINPTDLEDPPADDERVLSALAQICRPGLTAEGLTGDGQFGVMQQLRQEGIPVFGVYFTADESDAQPLSDDASWLIDFLRPIVEGRGTVAPSGDGRLAGFDVECADVDESGLAIGGATNGAYIESEDPVALAFEFLRLEAGLLGGSGAPLGDDGYFTVPAGTAYFRILLPTDDRQSWSLLDDTGEEVSIPSDAIATSGGVTSVEIEVDQTDWETDWQVAGPSGSFLYYFTGLILSRDRDRASSILSGIENSLTGKIMPEDGRAVEVTTTLQALLDRDDSGLGNGVVDVAVVTGDVAFATESPGSVSSTGIFAVEGLVPNSASAIEIRVSVPLNAPFEPIESTFQLEVLDSGDFAFLSDKSLELSTLEGLDGLASTTLEVRRPSADAGPATFCIDEDWLWLRDTPNAGNWEPRDPEDFARSVNGCVDVEPGDDVLEIPLGVSNSEQLDSRVDAAMTVTSTSAKGVEFSETILLGFESRTQQDPWVVAAAIILLLVLGLGLPLMALWLWNRLATKFAPVDAVTRAVYPVRIQRAGRFAIVDARRDSAGQKITVAPNDFSYVTPQPKSTTFDAQRGAMHARVPWFPLAASWFEWTAPPSQRIVSVVPGSAKQTASIAEHRAAEVAPDVARAWALLLSDAGLASDESEIDGELVVFSAMQSDVRQYQRRVDDILLSPGLSDAVDAAAHAARTAPAVSAETVSASVPVEVGVGAPSSASAGSGAPTPPSGAPMPPSGAPQPPSSASPHPSTDQGQSAPPSGPLAPPSPPPAGPLAPPPPPA